MNQKTKSLILWSAKCKLSFKFCNPKKTTWTIFGLTLPNYHCPIPSAQNNLIIQSNHNYLLPMKIKLSKNLLNPSALNNPNEDCHASFSPQWWSDLNYPHATYCLRAINTPIKLNTNLLSICDLIIPKIYLARMLKHLGISFLKSATKLKDQHM
jgi:hypothetical protein